MKKEYYTAGSENLSEQEPVITTPGPVDKEFLSTYNQEGSERGLEEFNALGITYDYNNIVGGIFNMLKAVKDNVIGVDKLAKILVATPLYAEKYSNDEKFKENPELLNNQKITPYIAVLDQIVLDIRKLGTLLGEGSSESAKGETLDSIRSSLEVASYVVKPNLQRSEILFKVDTLNALVRLGPVNLEEK